MHCVGSKIQDRSIRNAMSWKSEVDEIERRREAARAMGGPEAVERQHARGRLTSRERLDRLVDDGSLEEQGPIAGEAERGDGLGDT